MTTDSYRQHLDQMSVRQARIHDADTRWYLTTANGYIASTGFVDKADAERELELRRSSAQEDAA